MSTCGDPDCTMSKGHGGDLHVGKRDANGQALMWPMKHARESYAARGLTGPITGMLAPPTPPSEETPDAPA